MLVEAFTAVCLGYGSYKDIKTREIPDTLWLIMGGVGVVLRLFDHQWKVMGVSVGIALVLGAVLLVSGLFGGADIKAFIALSLLVPQYPGAAVVLPVFVVSVFNNLAVIRVIEILVVFLYNIVKGNWYKGDIPQWKKILLYMTGFPREKEKVDYRFLPLQDLQGDIHLVPDIDTDIEQFKKECTLKEIWVTYGSPLIAYITVGCFIAFIKGDILLHLMMHFAGF